MRSSPLLLATLVATATATAGCLGPMPKPPTAGYGDPYRGTGQTIFVKDSRTDWDIHEGDTLISTERALEASGDPEYELRRQAMKAHNAKLYAEAQAHRRRGYLMIGGSVAVFVLGAITSIGVSSAVANEDVMAPTAELPETRHTTPSGLSVLAALVGNVLMFGGVGGAMYGYYGARKPPSYVPWRVPAALDRPAYIRRFTEEYNEQLRPPPGVPPAKAPLPRPRGGR